MDGMEVLRKRMKTTEGSEGEGGGGGSSEAAMVMGMDDEEAAETNVAAGSEEMELSIQRILDKIEHFTQQVSELLESGKTMFKDLSNEFEERLITIHRERMEAWQEEIRELRQMDASNEATRALLQNAQYHILRNVRQDA